MLSSADHSVSPPRIEVPRAYNAAHDLLERNLRAGRSARPAYIDDEGTWSYGELASRVSRFANVLVQIGVHSEERVVLCLTDSIDFPTAFLGSIKAGVIPVAVNTLLTASDLGYVLADSRARTLVISASLLPTFESAFAGSPHLRHVIVSGDPASGHLAMRSLLEAASDRHETAPTTCDDMCFWLYSSGSTGSPKGTVHIHASMIRTAELYAKPIAGFAEDDVVFSASKLPFAYGLGNALTFPLAVGATAVLMAERPTSEAIIARLRKYRPTVFCTIPTAYASLLAHTDLPSREELGLRTCISAGEALPAEIGKRWFQHFGVDILDGVGSTEMLHIYLSNRGSAVQYGTSGVPVPGYDVRIVDESGQPVAPGQSGDLHVRGPTGALLYWNDRARSRSTFFGEWIRTGDKYRQREDGYFIYEGRSDDMLKVSGLYVSPTEVESVLIAHDAVLEAAVVAKEDAAGLTKPCAFVVLKAGQSVSVQELQRHVKMSLAPHKYPRWIEFVSALPKTATGKIQRFRLREQAASL